MNQTTTINTASLEHFQANIHKQIESAYHNARSLIAEGSSIVVQYYIEEQAFIQTYTTTAKNGDIIRKSYTEEDGTVAHVQTTTNHELTQTPNIINVCQIKHWTFTEEMKEAHGTIEGTIKACIDSGMYADHIYIASNRMREVVI